VTTTASVRAATENDLEHINAIVRAAYSPYIDRIGKLPASTTTDFGPLIESAHVFIAELSGEIVALVVLTPHGDSLELSSLSVRPDRQRQGLGRLLVSFAEQRATTLGFEALSLYTNARLEELIRYYRRCGFEVTDRRHDQGFDRVFMLKVLNSDRR
jgi:GNAT superfamily N-acetyltransferase